MSCRHHWKGETQGGWYLGFGRSFPGSGLLTAYFMQKPATASFQVLTLNRRSHHNQKAARLISVYLRVCAGDRAILGMQLLGLLLLFLFFFKKILFIYGYPGSLLLRGLFCSFPVAAASVGYSLLQCAGFSWQRLLFLQSTALGHSDFSSYSSQGSRAQAQQLWGMGLVAPWHVESSWIRDRTCVSCIGRQVLYH